MSNTDTQSPVIDLDPDDVVEEGRKKTESALAPKAKSSRGVAPLVGFTLLAGLVAGGWFYREFLSSYFPSDDVAAMRERLTAIDKTNEDMAVRLASAEKLAVQLSQDIDSLESHNTNQTTNLKQLTDSQSSVSEDLAKLAVAQSKIAADLEKLRAAPVSAAPSSGTVSLPADFSTRIETLEKDVAVLKSNKVEAKDTAQDRQVLTQTLADLKAKVEAGVPFADEHSRIESLVPAAAGLDVLSRHAASGLPTTAGLALELAALKPSLPTPDLMPKPAAEPGMWDQILDTLSDVITIRDLDAVNWQVEADKALVFAEAGDLAQAVSSIDAVEAAKPAELQQWRDKAQSRLALETALAATADAVARQLAATP